MEIRNNTNKTFHLGRRNGKNKGLTPADKYGIKVQEIGNSTIKLN